MCTRSAAYTKKAEPASNAALSNLVLKMQSGRGKHRRNSLISTNSAAKQKLNDVLESSDNDGERSAWWLYNRAMLDSSVGNHQQAQKEFREALLAPDHLMAYHLTRLAIRAIPRQLRMLGLKISVIGFVCVSAMLFACCGDVLADDRIIESNWADSDPGLDTNPVSLFWRDSLPTYMDARCPWEAVTRSIVLKFEHGGRHRICTSCSYAHTKNST